MASRKFRLDRLSRPYIEYRIIEALAEKGSMRHMDLFRKVRAKGYANFFRTVKRMERNGMLKSSLVNPRHRVVELSLGDPVVKACLKYLSGG